MTDPVGTSGTSATPPRAATKTASLTRVRRLRRHFGSRGAALGGASFPSMPPRLRAKTARGAGAPGERPRPRPKPRAMPTAKAKAAAKALAEKNSRRHLRREACKSLNELARKLLVPGHNLVDAMKGRSARQQVGKSAGRSASRQVGRMASRQAAWSAGRQVARSAGRQVGRLAGRQVGKSAGR